MTTSPQRFRLDGKTAIVTGASSGLGVAIAQCLAEAGADLVLGARRLEGLDRTRRLVEECGRHAVTVQTDITDPDQCTALVTAAVGELGRVDVLINNAGLASAAPATRESPEEFRRVIETNLLGSYWMAQAFGRAAAQGGSLVNISSILALRPAGIPQAAYASSKAALLGMTRDLASQWTGRKGIRVNAICPGFFPSEMSDQLDAREQDLVTRAAPAGRIGSPHEIGDACVFLASEASSYITGTTLCVDGGLTMR